MPMRFLPNVRFFPAEMSGYPLSLPAGITVQIDKSGSRFDTEK